jgi:hypothetical protein
MRAGDGQERADPLPEPLRVLRPELVVQEHPHRVHPDALRQRQFPVDPRRVPGRRLPHLQLVDRRGGV